MWQRPPNSERSSPEAADSFHATQQPEPEFTPQQRELLLRIAHEAIACAVEGRAYLPPDTSEALIEPRGVFTTLYRAGRLRGCVGYVSAVRPLIHAVAETARAAALDDTRFLPVEPAELAGIEVSLSVLSRTFAIEPAQIEVGRHGLVVRQHGRKGLLLPQVATEHGWDVKTFLEQTCLKAGLEGDAWQHGAEIEAFTAEIFGDSALRL